MLNFRLAVLEKWLEIGQWPAVILHSGYSSVVVLWIAVPQFITLFQLYSPMFIPISFPHSFASVVQDIVVFLPFIMPVLVARLGTQEVTESSEELRLSLVSLLSSFMDLCSSNMAPYLSDTVSILQRTIVDAYPEVKKVGSAWKPLYS